MSQQENECPIFLEDYKEPVIGPCGHALCSSCAQWSDGPLQQASRALAGGPEERICQHSSSSSSEVNGRPQLTAPSMRACQYSPEERGADCQLPSCWPACDSLKSWNSSPPSSSQCIDYSPLPSPASKHKMPASVCMCLRQTSSTWAGQGYAGCGPWCFPWRCARSCTACDQRTRRVCRGRESPSQDRSSSSMRSGEKNGCSTPSPSTWRDGESM